MSRADASVYRPKTKDGDPRIWFSKLKAHCAASDIMVVIWSKEKLWILNATRDLFAHLSETNAEYRKLLKPLANDRESIFEELLEMLRGISARGFIPALKRGDTAVGHLLETELGIKANSRKIPDYKGIEIKSSRAKSAVSQTMFAKVPNWGISQLKSSREILEKFGYERGEDLKLYCTVSSQKFNSQGLSLKVDEGSGQLNEISNIKGISNVVSWRIHDLQSALAEKHADTFWIDAQSRRIAGVEQIHFRSLRQTTKPIIQQLVPMLNAGTITVDHLIKRTNTRVSERGPLFKINKKNFDDLFPDPIFHDLTSGRTVSSPK